MKLTPKDYQGSTGSKKTYSRSTWKCGACGSLKYYNHFQKPWLIYCLDCKKESQRKRRINKHEHVRSIELKSKRLVRENEPLKSKARTLTNHLQWGKGATDRMMALISLYIDKPCKYCDVLLTLKNLSLDHKIPFSRRKRTRSTKPNLHFYTPEDQKRLNSEGNLQIVCISCNRLKNDFSDEQYMKLLTFLNTEPELKDKVLLRLRTSNFLFKY